MDWKQIDKLNNFPNQDSLNFLPIIWTRAKLKNMFCLILLHSKNNWDKEQQSKAQNSDSKYRQMALTGFDT